MLKNKLIVTVLLLSASFVQAQTLTLPAILDSIRANNPMTKMYDNEIRAMDEAAKGAKAWMPPTFGIGQFMTPYDVSLWKKTEHEDGMGFVMLSAEQMFPNKKKLEADQRYMSAMSTVEKEKKNASLNELYNNAKEAYYQWIILEKKRLVVTENEKILDFMIRNAEIRYKNGLEKISAYYKAKAALGDTKNMQLMYESEISESRIRLNTLMTRNPLIFFNIDTNYTLTDFSGVIFDSALLYSRSDLKALDREIDLNLLKQETERAAMKPQFGLKYDNMFGFGGQPVQYTLMAMIKVPIGGSTRMNKANIESLKWKSYALQSQKQVMLNEYSGMAYTMRNELDLKKRQLRLYEEIILPALRNNYRTMQLGYEQNTEELFMLYDAWERLNMKQLEYIDLLDKALRLQVTIERIIEKNTR